MTKQKDKEFIKPVPDNVLAFYAETVSRMETRTDLFMKTEGLGEDDEVVIKMRELVSKGKEILNDELDFLAEAVERLQFWVDIFVNTNCLSEGSELIIQARAYISNLKEQLLQQGRTVRTLTEVTRCADGRAFFPGQKTEPTSEDLEILKLFMGS